MVQSVLTIHNAPIDDVAKTSHLKTLVKGKAKAANAGLGYSVPLYHTAWDKLVRNFESATITKYAQLITTCVS